MCLLSTTDSSQHLHYTHHSVSGEHKGALVHYTPAISAAFVSFIMQFISFQALDKHVKVPLSSSKSTRNVRVALETNGKYAVKAG